MPCNSDYLEPTNKEVNLSKVKALLTEIQTGELPKWYNSGFQENNKYAEGNLDLLVHTLCGQLQLVEDITKYSLEMQLWWREHQKADKERLQKELQLEKDRVKKEELLSKLTPYEIELIKKDL